MISTTYLDAIFISQKNTIRKTSKLNILFKQTLRDIILLFLDLAGLEIDLEEWKEFCRKAWENGYDFLKTDRFARIGEGTYTIRNCNKITYTECIPETKYF